MTKALPYLRGSFSVTLFAPLLLLVAFVPLDTNALQFPSRLKTAVPIAYGAYSIVIDRIAQRKLNQMKSVQAEMACIDRAEDMDGAVPSWTPSELRTTVSKRNFCVTDPMHRRAWHKWRLTPNSTNENNSDPLLEPGHTYDWLYRSYVNREEKYAIAASLGNWKNFLLTHTESTKLFVDGDGIKITLVDKFRLAMIIPVVVNWHGSLIYSNVENRDDPSATITWTKTMAKIGPKTQESPAIAEKLSAEPWDVVKCEDGMICFQRGDIGYLVFDKMS